MLKKEKKNTATRSEEIQSKARHEVFHQDLR